MGRRGIFGRNQSRFAFRERVERYIFRVFGDDGWGASWPASSPYVVGVGGTSLELSNDGTLVSESAWSGSGGGVSAYETEPDYQKTYSIPKAGGKRAIPDVSYDADPQSGFPVYKTTGSSKNGWYEVGGTSAGAPQWAAIQALGQLVSLASIYKDKASSNTLDAVEDGKVGLLIVGAQLDEQVNGLVQTADGIGMVPVDLVHDHDRVEVPEAQRASARSGSEASVPRWRPPAAAPSPPSTGPVRPRRRSRRGRACR